MYRKEAATEAECERRGWELLELVEDAGYSAGSLKRPGIQRAFEALGTGEADGLMVTKLDRLSRSMLDFTALMARAQKEEWALVAMDCAADTTTPAGEAMANILATFAQFERRLIGQRQGSHGGQEGGGSRIRSPSAGPQEGRHAYSERAPGWQDAAGYRRGPER